MNYPDTSKIAELANNAKHIVVLQADNPDADSLGSALALEHILGDLGKEVTLYCSTDMPTYLRYLTGWDRVQKELPSVFDVAVIIDASTTTLIDKLHDPHFKGKLTSKPVIVLDHHEVVTNAIEFASASIVDDTASSTGELIYLLSKQAGLKISVEAGECIMAAILGDTQGLTNELTTATTYRVMSELVKSGVSRPELEEKRRLQSKMTEPIFRYKADLIKRTELHDEGRVAIVAVPQHEINEYSPSYNPPALIQFDTLQVSSVLISIVLKRYDSGRVTAAIRANNGAPIAAQLAEHFGGGGHAYASGFKIEQAKPINELKADVIAKATELLHAYKEKA
jgi:phosphoesterase RecJ-like protein